MGRNIYLTDKEIIQLRNACEYYIDWAWQDDDGEEVITEYLNNGLGSGLRKLFKGTNKEKEYTKYK